MPRTGTRHPSRVQTQPKPRPARAGGGGEAATFCGPVRQDLLNGTPTADDTKVTNLIEAGTGARIKALRVRRGRTQRGPADRAHVFYSLLTKVEGGIPTQRATGVRADGCYRPVLSTD